MRTTLVIVIFAGILPLATAWVAPSVMQLRSGGTFQGSTTAQRRPSSCNIQMSMKGSTRREFGLTAGLATLGLVWPQEAHADRSYTSMNNAYKNYAPRIKAGIKFYREEVKAAIDAGDFAGVATMLGPGSKASKLAYVDKYASGVVGEVIELKGIAKIFASSITASDSESQVTQKLYQLLTKYAEFNEQIRAACTAGDKEAALKAWKAGDFALKLYIDTLNPEIPRSLGKLKIDEADVVPEPGAEGSSS